MFSAISRWCCWGRQGTEPLLPQTQEPFRPVLTSSPALSWSRCLKDSKGWVAELAGLVTGIATVALGGSNIWSDIVGSGCIGLCSQLVINRLVEPKEKLLNLLFTTNGALTMHAIAQIRDNYKEKEVQKDLDLATFALAISNVVLLSRLVWFLRDRESGAVVFQEAGEPALPKFKIFLPRAILEVWRIGIAVNCVIATFKFGEKDPIYHDFFSCLAAYYFGFALGGAASSLLTRKIQREASEISLTDISALPKYTAEGVRKCVLAASVVYPFLFIPWNRKFLVGTVFTGACLNGFITRSRYARLANVPIEYLNELQPFSDSQSTCRKVSRIAIGTMMTLSFLLFAIWQQGGFGDLGSILHEEEQKASLWYMTGGALFSLWTRLVMHRIWNLDERKTCENPSMGMQAKDLAFVWTYFGHFDFWGLPPVFIYSMIRAIKRLNSAVVAADKGPANFLDKLGLCAYGVAIPDEVLTMAMQAGEGPIPEVPMLALFTTGAIGAQLLKEDGGG